MGKGERIGREKTGGGTESSKRNDRDAGENI